MTTPGKFQETGKPLVKALHIKLKTEAIRSLGLGTTT